MSENQCEKLNIPEFECLTCGNKFESLRKTNTFVKFNDIYGTGEIYFRCPFCNSDFFICETEMKFNDVTNL